MKQVRQTPIAILGAGSWGTALALYLARLGQEVRLWSYQPDHVKTMLAEHANTRFLPGHVFPEVLHPVVSLSDAITGVTDILIATPSVGFRATLTLLQPLLKKDMRILWVTKGMDLDTGQLLHDVTHGILGDDYPLAVLSGPSFAREVASGLPTAIVAASADEQFAQDIVQRFNSPVLRVYSSSDVTGVEIGGVVKNVLAIACGISDGMGFGANARSALITRGLAEMARLGLALGAKYETFTGLTGVGDLVLTCTDDQSRNRRFGLALGKGKNATNAEREIGQVVEGKRNAELVVQLAHKLKVEMPITETVWAILQDKITVLDAMRLLLSREPKEEIR
ncbi:MAG: NAD(P)H-dependent glycerol-3-phosphate dehydrogenase [Gammaproteobacteria bacterium]